MLREKKNSIPFIIVGVALVAIGPLLADNWYAGETGFFYNVGHQVITGTQLPIRWVMIAGIALAAWGLILRFKD